MANTIEVYADWVGLNGPVLIGSLQMQSPRQREVFSFTYDSNWLHSYAPIYQIDPDIQPFRGYQYQQPDKTGFGFFLDSCPDRWGRMLMQRREALLAKEEKRAMQKLQEREYLLGVDDASRMGAIRYKLPESSSFLAEHTALATPPWTELRMLEHHTSLFEQNEETEGSWIHHLILPGSSLGGARPKATVVDEKGNLWIAKFPSRHDTLNSGAWEMVIHDLAVKCGIDMPQSRLETFSAGGDTFLSKRFDRSDGHERIHFASAMTLTGKTDGQEASYLDLVECIIQMGAQPDTDLKQLFKRILFTIAVSNTDDHLRNHGFLLTPQGWKLSPAFDINPNPNGKALCLAIDEADHSLDFHVALAGAPFFKLSSKEATHMLDEILTHVSSWRAVAKSYGLNSSACAQAEGAFNLKT